MSVRTCSLKAGWGGWRDLKSVVSTLTIGGDGCEYVLYVPGGGSWVAK